MHSFRMQAEVGAIWFLFDEYTSCAFTFWKTGIMEERICRMKQFIQAGLVMLALIGLVLTPVGVIAQVISLKPTTVNVTLTTAGTEYSYSIPIGTTRLRVTARVGDVKYAWTTGQIAGGTFSTIAVDGSYCMGNVKLSQNGAALDVLYMTGSVNSTIAEIEVWK